jgi:hypothetical protein
MRLGCRAEDDARTWKDAECIRPGSAYLCERSELGAQASFLLRLALPH